MGKQLDRGRKNKLVERFQVQTILRILFQHDGFFDLDLTGIVSDVVATHLDVVECARECHCFSRKGIHIFHVPKCFYNHVHHLRNTFGFTEFIPTFVTHKVKYLLTAVVQKNPEVDGDQLLGELERTCEEKWGRKGT